MNEHGFDWSYYGPLVLLIGGAVAAFIKARAAAMDAATAKEIAAENKVDIKEQGKQIQATAIDVAALGGTVATLSKIEAAKADLRAMLAKNPTFDGNQTLMDAIDASVPDPSENSVSHNADAAAPVRTALARTEKH